MVFGEGVVSRRRLRERVGDRDDIRRRRRFGTVRGHRHTVVSRSARRRAPPLESLHPVEEELIERQHDGVAGPTEAVAGADPSGGPSQVRRRRDRARRLAEPELAVDDSMKTAVVAGREGTTVEHREIILVHPIPTFAELGAHPIVETCARQRVRHRDADVVGAALAHEPASRLDLLWTLTGITELQEEPASDPGRPQATG